MAFSNLRYDICQLAMKRFMTVMWLKEMSEDVILRIKWRRARGPCAGQPSNVMCRKKPLTIKHVLYLLVVSLRGTNLRPLDRIFFLC